MTVLFADLAGFTSYSEQHDPIEVAQMLNTYFDVAIPAVERHGGEVDRLIGDALFATFAGGRSPRAGGAGRARSAGG